MSGVGNSGGGAVQFGQRIVHAFLNEHIEEVQALGAETIGLMNGLLTALCQKANEEAAALIAETAENQVDGEQLHGRLEELSLKLQTTEAENIELKEGLQELAGEMEQRQAEYEAELQAFKQEMDRQRSELQQSGLEQQRLKELFREDEIKFREMKQQKQLLEHTRLRDIDRRHMLETELQKVQGQLVQLSLKFQTLERSHDQLSQSVQSKEECIRHLNRIIEESEYLSSLSPHSHPHINDLPEQDNSYASQKLARTLRDEQIPLIRLSQSQLPVQQSLESISAVSIEEEPQHQLLGVPKSERTLVASESKPKKHTKAVVLSQQKASKEEGSLRKDPEKSKTVRQETKTIALSKQDPKAVKSKLTSIFRDRLKYKSQQDQIHEDRLNQLKYRLREREDQIQNLNRQVSLLKVVRAEPIVVSSNSREGKREVQHLRAENESLRRISKEISLRKEYLESELEELKERCAYYKTEHKKVYEQYLLKNAESVAYSQQLSEMEISYYRQRQEKSIIEKDEGEDEGFLRVVPIEQQRDEFQDLSSKFNNLVLKHSHTAFNNELQEPSFKSAQGNDPRDFYTIQNIHLADISANERTLEHERRLPIKQGQIDRSPAKAVLDQDAHMEDLMLEGIQQIAMKEQPAGEIQTERLILSQLMQSSRRENTLTEFQILFSQHPVKSLQLVSLGCLVMLSERQNVMKIMATQSITIKPRKLQLSIAPYEDFTLFPKEKTSVSVGNHTSSHEIHTQTRAVQLSDYSCQVFPERVDFGQQFMPSLKEAQTATDFVELKQVQTNTILAEMTQIGMNTNGLETFEHSTSTNPVEITQCSMNTDQISTYSSSMQTVIKQFMEAQSLTDKLLMLECSTSTNTAQFQSKQTQYLSNRSLAFFKTQCIHQKLVRSRLQIIGPFNATSINNQKEVMEQGTNFELSYISQQINERQNVMKIMATQSINIEPRKLQLSFASCQDFILFPKEKMSVSVGNHTSSHKIHTQTSIIQLSDYFCQVFPEKVDFGQQFMPSLNEVYTATDLKEVMEQGTNFELYCINQQTNTDIKSSRDASTNHGSRQLELSPQTSSLIFVPTITKSKLTLKSEVFQYKINRGSCKLQLDLSFLNNQHSQLDEKSPCEDQQQTITQKPQLRYRNAGIGAQLSSCRTRCSSQDIHSNRSGHPEKGKKRNKAMRESMISQHSEGSDQPNKNEQLCISKGTAAPTASNTPFVDKQDTTLVVSRMVMETEQAETEMRMQLEKEGERTKEEESKTIEVEETKRVPVCGDQQMRIIKDYFYRMKRVEHCQKADFTQKHQPGYDFQKNLYIFETVREQRPELFALWNGRVIHFGSKVEKMQLGSPHSNCQWSSGNINLGNSEFRILGSRLQVCRREKQRLFKGEMENGEWRVQRVWTWTAN